MESHSALTTLRAPSMDGEWGGGKGKDRLTVDRLANSWTARSCRDDHQRTTAVPG